jgi:hypothetical protein
MFEYEVFHEAASKTGGIKMNQGMTTATMPITAYSFCDCHKLTEAKRVQDAPEFEGELLLVRYEQWGASTSWQVQISMATGSGAWLPQSAKLTLNRGNGEEVAEWTATKHNWHDYPRWVAEARLGALAVLVADKLLSSL